MSLTQVTLKVWKEFTTELLEPRKETEMNYTEKSSKGLNDQLLVKAFNKKYKK